MHPIHQPVPDMAKPYIELNWHLVVTKSLYERKVSASLRENGVDVFLPMTKVVRQWSDRKVKLDMPLFPNYVFVKLSEPERNRVFVNGVINFVMFSNKPAIVSDKTINYIRLALNGEPESVDHTLSVGDRVLVTSGPMQGLSGLLIEHKGRHRLAIRIELMHRYVIVDVKSGRLERLS